MTSYVMVPLDVEGCRRVAVETEPFADNMHTALGPCCANAKSFEPISCTFEDTDSDTIKICSFCKKLKLSPKEECQIAYFPCCN